jgi:hypothetical protein
VAPVLGNAETTARTHLRHLFEKTGTGRQADLVKIVADVCQLPRQVRLAGLLQGLREDA